MKSAVKKVSARVSAKKETQTPVKSNKKSVKIVTPVASSKKGSMKKVKGTPAVKVSSAKKSQRSSAKKS